MKKAARAEDEHSSEPDCQANDQEQTDCRWTCFLAHNTAGCDSTSAGYSPRVRKAFSLASSECFSKSFGLPCARMVRESASRKMESSAIVKMLASSWVTTTIVAPRLSRSSRIKRSRFRELIGSRPADGSSKKR